MANLLALVPTAAVTTPMTTNPLILNGQPRNLTIQANFAYGSGGISFDAYAQVSLDSGTTWTDVANFHFTTANARKAVNLSVLTPQAAQIALTDGAMTANTAQDGILGPRIRVKYQSTGSYLGTWIAIDVQSDQIPAFS